MTEQYHFIGIGGSGMSGLARMLLAAGVRVSGSDLRESDTTRELRAQGATVQIGHQAENINGATHVVYTAAAREDNPELAEARRRGLPVIVRAEMLGRVMRGKIGVAIAGTHGKTTTTGMAASVFLAAGADPSVLIGGDWASIGGNAHPGRGRHFLAEACEAFNSFLHLEPRIAILTNVEADHLDCHGSLEGVLDVFRRFLDRVDPQGYVIGCGDDAHVRALLSGSGRRTVTYGLGPDVEYAACDLALDRREPTFTLIRRGETLGTLTLGVPGRHNVLNALAVATLALEEGLPFEAIAEGLARFRGVERRFETLGEVAGVLVMDDYAHHPTEVAATLDATRRSLSRHTTVIFQPHLYSRTQLLMEEFAQSFGQADRLFVVDIYAAREEPIAGVSSETLVRRIRETTPQVEAEYAPDREALLQRLAEEARPGDLVMTMGAGDIRELGTQLVERLR